MGICWSTPRTCAVCGNQTRRPARLTYNISPLTIDPIVRQIRHEREGVPLTKRYSYLIGVDITVDVCPACHACPAESERRYQRSFAEQRYLAEKQEDKPPITPPPPTHIRGPLWAASAGARHSLVDHSTTMTSGYPSTTVAHRVVLHRLFSRVGKLCPESMQEGTPLNYLHWALIEDGPIKFSEYWYGVKMLVKLEEKIESLSEQDKDLVREIRTHHIPHRWVEQVQWIVLGQLHQSGI